MTLATHQILTNFDRNQLKEWITSHEDELAEFAGSDLVVAEIVAAITVLYRDGKIDRAQAETWLAALQRL